MIGKKHVRGQEIERKAVIRDHFAIYIGEK